MKVEEKFYCLPPPSGKAVATALVRYLHAPQVPHWDRSWVVHSITRAAAQIQASLTFLMPVPHHCLILLKSIDHLISLNWQKSILSPSQAVLSALVTTYHPHHHVRESCNPEGRRSKSNHEPFFQVGFVTVGHCEIQDKTQWPCEEPLQDFCFASCKTNVKEPWFQPVLVNCNKQEARAASAQGLIEQIMTFHV